MEMEATGDSILREPSWRERTESLAYLRNLESEWPAAGEIEPLPRTPVAVLGAGVMGTAIAATYLKGGFPVVLYDVSEEVLEGSVDRITKEWNFRVAESASKDGASYYSRRSVVQDRLLTTVHLADVAECRVVLETIPEKLRAKRKLYRSLEKMLSPESFLFTNTSTIEIDQLAEAAPLASRFCGFHFFHPVRDRSLVEIIAGRRTGPEILDMARLHALALDKRPLLVRDGPGFLVNRLLNPYLSEAFALMRDGATMQQLERVPERFGMWAGPLRIMDEIGLDVTMHAGNVLQKAFPHRAVDSQLLIEMVMSRRLGRKVGRGFMIYNEDALWKKPGTIDPEVEEMVLACVGPGKTYGELDDEDVARRLIGAMLLEGAEIVEDGVVRSVEDCDLAVVHGLGFPAERGGLFQWFRQLGRWRQERFLASLAAVGKRFEPNGLFQRWVTHGTPSMVDRSAFSVDHKVLLEGSGN